jgi:hypothetical protein
VHKVDGHEFDGAKAPVDAPDELVHRRPQILVLLDVLPGWDGELDQNNLSAVSISVYIRQ